MEMINLKIDGIEVAVPKDTTILEAAKQLDIKIPTLCYMKEMNEVSTCRICVVEVEGWGRLQPACVAKVSEGMNISTNNMTVRNARRDILELILASHNRECLSCPRNLNCELQDVCNDMSIDSLSYDKMDVLQKVDSTGPIVRDPNKCILCGRCVSVCDKVQQVNAIDFANKGAHTTITTCFDEKLSESECINCGQCIKVCPVGALTERSDIDRVWSALDNDKLHVVVQTAPAVRVAIGEEFGFEYGENVEGKMVTALKRLGFDSVFDTNFTADLTILEEGTELLTRIKTGGKLPLITSCSPGWIKYCEHNHHDFLENLSTCKSPQQMFGALAKSYYADKMRVDPKNMFVVSVMPCTAKKYEADRPEMQVDGHRDVDVVITTRELAKMIKQAGIDFKALSDGTYDSLLGKSTGAAVIFGNTGGVMEAALRTVADILTGQDLTNIEYTAVRGVEGIKEATVNINGMDIHVAVANGTGNASKLLEKIRSGEANYHFVEVMACPGGCVNGGGQPIIKDKSMTEEVKKLRLKSIYEIDRLYEKRKSHENPDVKQLYTEFLGEANSHKAHHLLHTHYTARTKNEVQNGEHNRRCCDHNSNW